jgi:hypothetical protein
LELKTLTYRRNIALFELAPAYMSPEDFQKFNQQLLRQVKDILDALNLSRK